MRLLWIATKPPVPPIDGGRLVALLTLRALAEVGVDVDLVSPLAPGGPVGGAEGIEADLAPICRPHLVPTLPRPVPFAVARSLLGGPPYSIVRHGLPAVRAEVARLLDTGRFDAVHVEQLQALPQAEPALRRGAPVVLRAQNVESDLWRATAGLHPWAGPWFAREARRLARFEGLAVARMAATVALTAPDAARLGGLAARGVRIEVVPPPFPATLPAGDRRLAGEPPLVILGSGGWLPNRDGTRWFLEEAWPRVRARVHGARLHLFAGTGPSGPLGIDLPEGVERHPPPDDSRDAFAPGSILVVPLRIASGIRMKILEAWARGVPAIATPEAAAGLGAEPGRELLVAGAPRELADAVELLASPSGPYDRIVKAGRERLSAVHDPAVVAARLTTIHRSVRRG